VQETGRTLYTSKIEKDVGQKYGGSRGTVINQDKTHKNNTSLQEKLGTRSNKNDKTKKKNACARPPWPGHERRKEQRKKRGLGRPAPGPARPPLF
jgi:hypothetical protein